jgi:glycosyltransferase involved in cell wall biosynthesis
MGQHQGPAIERWQGLFQWKHRMSHPAAPQSHSMTDELETERPLPQQPAAKDNRPSILFCSPMNILDITSGAALSMRTLLASLASRGFRCVALQAQLYDSEQGGEHVDEAANAEGVRDKKILRSMVLGVEHLIVRTKARRRPDMRSEEEEIYLQRFHEELAFRRPDMIILWGGLLLEMTLMREARLKNIPVVFYLVNAGYKFKETFRDVSVIITDTQATAKLYRERHGFNPIAVGKFIDPTLVKADQRRPEFITFINPSFEKGVNVFLPLAKLAAKEAPEIKFLVVQSRGRWGVALQVLKFQPSDFPNVMVIGHQKNMKPVYASTKALLLPSTWHESGARVIAEAMINDIPVLASRTGGSEELVGLGGMVFDLPEVVREKRDTAAHEEVVRPWLEEIKRIWHDPAYYAQVVDKVRAEAVQHDLKHNTDRFLAAVEPAIRQSKAIAAAQTPASDVKGAVKQALAKKKQRARAR